MHGYVDQGSTAGVITLIARHGKIVHFGVYGKADIEASKAQPFSRVLIALGIRHVGAGIAELLASSLTDVDALCVASEE